MKDNISHTEILTYQPNWLEKFKTEKEILQNIFGDEALNIEHIGSTSIEGLPAKPIIDIAVMIENHKDADKFIEPLTKIGYKYDSPSAERHFFIKGNPVEFHLSIAYFDQGGFWKRQVLFRDYLRNHPETREEYAKLKKDLLQKYPTGKEDYIKGKSDFVQKVLLLAEKEPQRD